VLFFYLNFLKKQTGNAREKERKTSGINDENEVAAGRRGGGIVEDRTVRGEIRSHGFGKLCFESRKRF
jgi:hypothetical protein